MSLRRRRLTALDVPDSAPTAIAFFPGRCQVESATIVTSVKGALMSLSAHHVSRSNRFVCACGRPARFSRPHARGVARRADHTLCPRCWRALLNRARAEDVSHRRAMRVGFVTHLMTI